ncbi:MAG: putative Ig domain-containing protein, partial [Bacteroidales bacterium]|nr:putative Ig domain-containing protein [Bacteroidales bacterium]
QKAVILTTTLPDGTVTVPYSAALTADGDTPITWSIETGALPDGLTLNTSSGLIAGTPTAEGVFHFTVKATNSTGDDTKALSITITEDVGVVETLRATSLQVYPNPTTGQLRIKNEELREGSVVEVYNVVGQLMMQAPLNPPEGGKLLPSFGGVGGGLIIDVSSLANGIYFLKIGEKVVRFVKE